MLGPKRTLLLIEDNELNRDMLSRRLARAGYDVRCASTASEGLSLAQSSQPSLILMDLRLPDMNGWDATRALKADEQLRHVPIIALTAHAMEGDRERALAAGCDDYDTKPVELPRLLAKIAKLIDDQRGGPSHQATHFVPML